MKVYSAILSVQYEGNDLLGVFADRDSAVAHIKTQEGYLKKWLGDYGVVESELGQPVDIDAQVEWVE
jgi:hypothetical protein